MTVHRLASLLALDSETTSIVVSAFDRTWESLVVSGHPATEADKCEATRALLAKRMIASAQGGVRNVEILMADALAHLANQHE